MTDPSIPYSSCKGRTLQQTLWQLHVFPKLSKPWVVTMPGAIFSCHCSHGSLCRDCNVRFMLVPLAPHPGWALL